MSGTRDDGLADLAAHWGVHNIHDLAALAIKRGDKLGERVDQLNVELAAAEDRVAQLTEAVENARRFAAHVEAQNAAALALHWLDPEIPNLCHGCLHNWPCSTARALSGEPSPVVEREG